MKTILGSMTFGEQVDRSTAATLIERYLRASGEEIDTAHAYVDGKTETMLGDLIGPEQHSTIRIATKVNPWNDRGLNPKQVMHQFEESLNRLQVDRVELLYLHAPDLNTPIADTLQACNELYQQGRFKRFGLSNYAAWQVAEIVETCRRYDWIAPTVYQGLYNALTRGVEAELFPCLRNYGISFYAYNPLAGGLLSGKYQSQIAVPDDGRFGLHEAYRDRYWKQDYFGVMKNLADSCEDSDINPVQAAFGWLKHHSLLDADQGDGIIVGVSRPEQLEQNLEALNLPALNQAIIEALDRGWELTRPNSFCYFRT